MAAYVTESYYINTYGGRTVPEENLKSALHQASRHIDSLTYNRIVGRGFDNLTDFQKEVIREVICLQADFECENAEKELSCSPLISAFTSLTKASIRSLCASKIASCFFSTSDRL